MIIMVIHFSFSYLIIWVNVQPIWHTIRLFTFRHNNSEENAPPFQGMPIIAALAHGPKSQILYLKNIKYERISLRRWI